MATSYLTLAGTAFRRTSRRCVNFQAPSLTPTSAAGTRIFVDRDGEHFGHVLAYMRDGHLAVMVPGARSSVTLMRMLKREFGFYCIEVAPLPVDPVLVETAFVMGGEGSRTAVKAMRVTRNVLLRKQAWSGTTRCRGNGARRRP
jgi:hypothetical protein